MTEESSSIVVDSHDAQINSLWPTNDALLRLDLSPLFVLRPKGDAYQTWRYDAVLLATSVGFLDAKDLGRDWTWILDGSLEKADGTLFNDFSQCIGQPVECEWLLLQLASGGQMRVNCGSVQIDLGDGALTDEVFPAS